MRDDADIQETLDPARAGQLAEPTGVVDAIPSTPLDEDALAAHGDGHEQLDQIVTKLLVGVR